MGQIFEAEHYDNLGQYPRNTSLLMYQIVVNRHIADQACLFIDQRNYRGFYESALQFGLRPAMG
jgi:hypothetical protein